MIPGTRQKAESSIHQETPSHGPDSLSQSTQIVEPPKIGREHINPALCEVIPDPVLRQTLLESDLPWKYIALLMLEDLLCEETLRGKTTEQTIAHYCRELYRLYPEMFPPGRNRKRIATPGGKRGGNRTGPAPGRNRLRSAERADGRPSRTPNR